MPLSSSPIVRLLQSTRLAVLACALLALLALWLAVRLGLALWPHADDVGVAVPAPGNVPVAAAPVSLASYHLFGAAPAQPGSGAPGAAAAITGLILRGTLADHDPQVGVAMIDGAGDGERAFRVGDEILPGVKLVAVHADRITLSREGREESLRLVRDTNPDPGNIIQPTPGVARARQTQVGDAPASAAPANAPAPDTAGAGARAGGLPATLARLRADPSEIMRHVRVMPVLEQGQLAGVRVSAASGDDAALLGQLGLQSGDVVTAVDGQRVDSLERGQQIMARLGNATSVRVTVLRNGKPTDITVGTR